METIFRVIDEFLNKLLRLHWPSVVLMTLMSVAGVFFIHSATHLSDRPELHEAARQQILWIGMGFGLFMILSMLNYRTLVEWSFWILGAVVALLIVTLIVATPINGAKSWIRIGGFGIQAAELAKLAFILASAHLLVVLQEHIKKFWLIVAVCGLALLPMALILKQPDFGSAAVFGPIVFFMLFAAGVRKRYLFIPVVGALALFLICFFWVHKMEKNLPLLKPYQNDRIRTFFDPKRDPRGAGWTISQSLIAVGSGGLKGKGYKKGDQNIYGFLPKNIAYNDFIFSVIAEEFGFVGGTLIILGEGALILCALQIAMRSSSFAGLLIATGFAGMLLAHFFVNVGMTIKVVPITGIPLPFISYGGTFMAVCMAGMGILQSIWMDRHRRSLLGEMT
ncbi:MAG: rod shape-determining protein RodA [Verrucomicrobiota bacterium]